MDDFSNEDLIRSFEEFDEMLPNVAKVIVQRGINFSILTADEEDSQEAHEASRSICTILREMVACTSEMTADEFEYYFNDLLVACELVVMIRDGLVHEEEGMFSLTAEGRSFGHELEEHKESTDQAGD